MRQQPYQHMQCEDRRSGDLHVDHLPEWLAQDGQDNPLPHVHTFYAVIWFSDGGGRHTVDFRSYDIEPNTFYLIAPGQVHHFEAPATNRGTMLKFCTNFLSDDLSHDDTFARYNLFSSHSHPVVRISDEARLAELRTLVEACEREIAREKDFAHLDIIRSLARIILVYIHRYGERHGAMSLDAMRPQHRLYLRYRQLVETQYRSRRNVADYAAQLAVSAKSLTRAVGECTGQTPLAVLNQRIALEARRLATFTQMQTKEQAYYLGFDDPSYYVKFFKRHHGLLPQECKEAAVGKGLQEHR